VKGERGAKRIDQLTGCGRIVKVLNDDWKIGCCKRNRRAVQDQQKQRENQREHERAPIANDLSQLLAGLREYSSHLLELTTGSSGNTGRFKRIRHILVVPRAPRVPRGLIL